MPKKSLSSGNQREFHIGKNVEEESFQVVMEIGQIVDLDICYFHMSVELGNRDFVNIEIF